MRGLVISDTHVHDYFQFNRDHVRLKNCIRVLHDINMYCMKNRINSVFFCGDLHDTHKSLLVCVVNELVEAFTRIFTANPSLIFYAISGNHDQSTKNLLDNPAITSLQYLNTIFPDNFILIDNAGSTVVDGVMVHGIPYYEYTEHFDEMLSRTSKMCQKGSRNYMLIHQTSKGIENDMIPYDCNPKDERFKAFDGIFCGHVHIRQQLAENFWNIGSPMHRDLADAGRVKGFYDLDFNTNEMTFIPLEGYPEYKELYEDEVTPEDSKHYVVTKQRLEEVELVQDAKIEEFSTSLSDELLVENYWNQVDGKDTELLKVGLGFL